MAKMSHWFQPDLKLHEKFKTKTQQHANRFVQYSYFVAIETDRSEQNYDKK